MLVVTPVGTRQDRRRAVLWCAGRSLGGGEGDVHYDDDDNGIDNYNNNGDDDHNIIDNNDDDDFVRWTLVGLLTWAMDDCSVPGVFARMAEFSDWLEGLGGASD